MIRVSSNTTLFWKFFLPIMYITFFGTLGMSILFEVSDINIFRSIYVKVGYMSIYLIFVLFMLFTIMRLKRVEIDSTHFVATNYFKFYKYQIEDIEKVKKYHFGIFRIYTIYLKSKGKFGKKIRFIPYIVGIEQVKANSTAWNGVLGG